MLLGDLTSWCVGTGEREDEHAILRSRGLMDLVRGRGWLLVGVLGWEGLIFVLREGPFLAVKLDEEVFDKWLELHEASTEFCVLADMREDDMLGNADAKLAFFGDDELDLVGPLDDEVELVGPLHDELEIPLANLGDVEVELLDVFGEEVVFWEFVRTRPKDVNVVNYIKRNRMY